MRLSKPVAIRTAMSTGVVVGIVYFTCMCAQNLASKQLWEERCRSLVKMKAVAVVAKEYFNKRGVFPLRINSDELRTCGKADGMEAELSKPIDSWLTCTTAPNEKAAIEQGRKLQPGHIVYCSISGKGVANGFRVIGKDSQGNFLWIHGHDPLILTDSMFP